MPHAPLTALTARVAALRVEREESNRGRLRVRDLPGKGCVFTLDLPLQPGQCAPEPLLTESSA